MSSPTQQRPTSADSASSVGERELHCPVCVKILRSAVETQCCNKCLCGCCVVRWTEEIQERDQSEDTNNEEQPTANEESSSKQDEEGEKKKLFFHCNLCDVKYQTEMPKPNIPIRELVLKLPTRCPNEFCHQAGLTYGTLEDHLVDCPMAPVDCPLMARGCAENVRRCQVGDHVNRTCAFRDVTCKLCQEIFMIKEQEMHDAMFCPMAHIDCPIKCGCNFQRYKLQKHLAECVLQPVTCPYRAMGCPLKDLVPRGVLATHMQSSVHAHLMLLDSHYRHTMGVLNQLGPLAYMQPTHEWVPQSLTCCSVWRAQPSTITALGFAGSCLISGCEHGTLALFDVNSGQCLRYLQAHEAGVAAQCINGTVDERALVGYRDGTLHCWGDALNMLCVATKVHCRNRDKTPSINDIINCVLPKNPHIFGDSRRAQLLHTELYDEGGVGEEVIQRAVFDAAVVACGDGLIHVFEQGTLSEVLSLEGHNGEVTCVSCVAAPVCQQPATESGEGSTEGTTSDGCCDPRTTFLLVSGSADDTLKVWDIQYNKDVPLLLTQRTFGNGVTTSATAMNGRVLFTGHTDCCLRVWELGWRSDSGAWKVQLVCRAVLSGHTSVVLRLCTVGTSNVVSCGKDQTLRVWSAVEFCDSSTEIDVEKESVELRGDRTYGDSKADFPCSVSAVAAVGLYLYTGGSQASIKLWSAAEARLNRSCIPHPTEDSFSNSELLTPFAEPQLESVPPPPEQ